MKTSNRAAIALLAVSFVGLPLTALAAPQSKTPFTQTETTAYADFGTVLTDGTHFLILGATGNGVTTSASDSRALGASAVTLNAAWDMNQLGPLWGGYHKVGPDGAWDGYFVGINSLVNGHVTSSLTNVAIGRGGYEGMILKKTGTRVDNGPVEWVGYFAAGGPGDLPLRVRSSRVDRLQIIQGMVLDPKDPTRPLMNGNGKIVYGALGLVNVISGVGEATHLGRETETGLGLMELTTFSTTAMGQCLCANGDLLNWVASSHPGPDDATTVDVHLVGGAGLMDDATGAFSMTFEETLTPTGDPKVFIGTFDYTGEGTIRYSARAKIRE